MPPLVHLYKPHHPTSFYHTSKSIQMFNDPMWLSEQHTCRPFSLLLPDLCSHHFFIQRSFKLKLALCFGIQSVFPAPLSTPFSQSSISYIHFSPHLPSTSLTRIFSSKALELQVALPDLKSSCHYHIPFSFLLCNVLINNSYVKGRSVAFIALDWTVLRVSLSTFPQYPLHGIHSS
jgi:hypothetical protein